MKKVLFIFAILLSTTTLAQQYTTAIGLKGGYNFFGGLNLNAKHFLSANTAVEGTIGGSSRHLWLQGLYEKNQALSHGVDWYYGGGADFGFWTNGEKYYHKTNDTYYTGVFGGLDGIIGLEYTFKDFPLNIAIDMGPTLRVFPYLGFGWGGGVAARFAIP